MNMYHHKRDTTIKAEPMVRVVGGLCEKCGRKTVRPPVFSGTVEPLIVPISVIRGDAILHDGCGGRVLLATEPADDKSRGYDAN